MSFRLSSFLLLLLVPMVTAAQASGPAEGDTTLIHPSLAAGSWALQFGVSQNFTLQAFEGSVISGQYHFTRSTALRVGVDGSFSHSKRGDPSEYSSKSLDFDLRVEYLVYLNPDRDVLFYVGGGPAFEYRFYRNQDSRSSTSSKYLTYGAGVRVGAEWFAVSWLSLHAEYGVRAGYQRQLHTGGGSPSDYTNWNIYPATGGFGLSIYP
jgi:hypothetical protein